jgi:hypothetical protein
VPEGTVSGQEYEKLLIHNNNITYEGSIGVYQGIHTRMNTATTVFVAGATEFVAIYELLSPIQQAT